MFAYEMKNTNLSANLRCNFIEIIYSNIWIENTPLHHVLGKYTGTKTELY